MDALYILRTHLHRPDQPQAVLSPGRVHVLGEPKIGECLVMVSQTGVVQTSPIRDIRVSDDCIELDTDNSRYTLGRSVKAAA